MEWDRVNKMHTSMSQVMDAIIPPKALRHGDATHI